MAYRINTTNKDEDLFAVNKHGWKNGISPPTTSTAGTDDFFNHAQEEIARIAESQGYTIPEEESSTDRYDMVLSAMRMQNFAVLVGASRSYTSMSIFPLRIVGGKKTVAEKFDSHIALMVTAGATVTEWISTASTPSDTTAPGAPSDVFDAVWSQGDDQFVLVGDGGKLWTKGSGSTPVSRTSGTANDLRTVTYDGTIYVAGGASGTIVTSTDGITWATRTSNLSGIIRVIAHNGTIFLASDNTASGDVSTSPDGIAWTNQTVTGLDSDIAIHKLVWNTARGRWFALAENLAGSPKEAQIVSSADGIAWTVELLLGTTVNEGRSLAVSPDGLVVVTSAIDSDGFLISDGRHPWKRIMSPRLSDETCTFIEDQFLFVYNNSLQVCGSLA